MPFVRSWHIFIRLSAVGFAFADWASAVVAVNMAPDVPSIKATARVETENRAFTIGSPYDY